VAGWVAGVVLAGGVLTGCSGATDEPAPTRQECAQDPARLGCSYGLPQAVAERQAAAAQRKAQRQARQEARQEARQKARQERRVRGGVAAPGSFRDWLEGNGPLDVPPGFASAPVRTPEPLGGWCEDVTSYDWNWDNDVLCTRADGTQFWTSYAGADAFLGG
jgi:type II secretory pathway pseudopilin PulG